MQYLLTQEERELLNAMADNDAVFLTHDESITVNLKRLVRFGLARPQVVSDTSSGKFRLRVGYLCTGSGRKEANKKGKPCTARQTK